jgi:hypothetical protein
MPDRYSVPAGSNEALSHKFVPIVDLGLRTTDSLRHLSNLVRRRAVSDQRSACWAEEILWLRTP